MRSDVPVLALIARLVPQKGVDVFAHALDTVLGWGVQLIMLGSGDPEAERFFSSRARERPEQFCAWFPFDDPRAHRIQAGADFFLMPSRFEPCGLSQLHAMRYGTLPVVRATGGLVDTVTNYDEATGAGTGFVFHDLRPGQPRRHDRMGCLDVAQPPPARRCLAPPGDGGGSLLGSGGARVLAALPDSLRAPARAPLLRVASVERDGAGRAAQRDTPRATAVGAPGVHRGKKRGSRAPIPSDRLPPLPARLGRATAVRLRS